MHTYSETKHLPHSVEQMFNLVVDIETYPQFLPWCRAARILSREAGGAFLGELLISFSHFSERYTSRVIPIASVEGGAARIDVELVNGPFRHLANHWRFTPASGGCEIALDLKFEFKSKLLDTMLRPMFARACEKMVAAFTERAAKLYGAPK